MLNLGLAVAFVSMLSFTGADILAKKLASKIDSQRTALLMLFGSFVVMLAGVFFTGFIQINSTAVLFSVLSGAFYALAAFLLYKSLETKQVSNTLALAGIEYALIAIFSVFILSESLSSISAASIVVIFVGAFFVTTNRKMKFDKGYAPALLGMVVYSISYFFLIFAQQSSGGLFLPLLINRAIALIMMAFYLKASPERGSKFKKPGMLDLGRKPLVLGAFLGLFNGIASIALVYLANLGSLAVGSAILAAEPAVVIFFGYFLYRDRFDEHQIIGFIIIVLGVIALGLA